MKIDKIDLLVLVIPVIIMIILIPILPNNIPIQWSPDGRINLYLDRRLGFLLGMIPFLFYKRIRSKYFKKKIQ